MSHFLQVFCYLLLIVSAYGLRSLRAAIHSSRGAQLAQIPRSKIMKRELLPQIAFAATCAGKRLTTRLSITKFYVIT